MAPRKKGTRKTASKAPAAKNQRVQKPAPKKASSRAKTAATTRSTRSTKDVPATTRTTRGTALNNTRSNVFNTTELLENILVHLEADDIHASKRVSNKFNDVMNGSPSITQQLNFAQDHPNNRIDEDDVEMWQPDHTNFGILYKRFLPADASSFGSKFLLRTLNTSVFKIDDKSPERKKDHPGYLTYNRASTAGEIVFFKTRDFSKIIFKPMRQQSQTYDNMFIVQPFENDYGYYINMEIRIGISVSIKVRDMRCPDNSVLAMVQQAFGRYPGADGDDESDEGEGRYGFIDIDTCSIMEPDRTNDHGIKVPYGLESGKELREKVEELEEKWGKEAKITKFSITLPQTVFPNEEERRHVASIREQRARDAAAAEDDDDEDDN